MTWKDLVIFIILSVSLFAFAALYDASFSAHGAETSSCGPLELVIAELAKHDEFPAAAWREAENTGRILFAKLDGSTWTLVMTDAAGGACTMRNGEDLKIVTTIPVA